MQEPFLESTSVRPNQSTYRAAGFFRRWFAVMVDSLLVVSCSLVAFVIVQKMIGNTIPNLKRIGMDWVIELLLGKNWDGFIFIFLFVSISWSYFFLQYRLLGKTLGQSIVRIRLIDEYGDIPSTVQLLIRGVVGLFSFVLLGLGYFWMLADGQLRTFGDIVAKTYVVKDKN